MGAITAFIGELFGSSGEKTPVISNVAQDSVEAEKKVAKASRAQLLSTEGGIIGQELTPEQVKKRTPIFGN